MKLERRYTLITYRIKHKDELCQLILVTSKAVHFFYVVSEL